MIYMKVGAQYGIYEFSRVSGQLEVCQKGGLQVGPVGDGALLVVADAGIYDDTSLTGVDDQCM